VRISEIFKRKPTAEEMAKEYNIDQSANYRRSGTGAVFTGKQFAELLAVATPIVQGMMLLTMTKTDEPATEPDSRYGPARAVK